MFTASAGNDAEPESNFPSRLAVDPQFAGSILTAGALNRQMHLASFSNRAGVAANGYILAPGEDVITDCGQTSCWRVAGTSFAASQVAGALALLLQYFPRLSGRDAIDILKRSTDEIGDPGVDNVYGVGVMNIAKAFQPIGARTLSLAGGEQIALPGPEVGSALSGAFGDAMLGGHGLRGSRLRAEASVGRTEGGGQLVDIDRAMSSSWRLAVSGACAPALPCRGFGLELAQPLRVERGTFSATLADIPTDDEAPLTYSQRRFSASRRPGNWIFGSTPARRSARASCGWKRAPPSTRRTRLARPIWAFPPAGG